MVELRLRPLVVRLRMLVEDDTVRGSAKGIDQGRRLLNHSFPACLDANIQRILFLSKMCGAHLQFDMNTSLSFDPLCLKPFFMRPLLSVDSKTMTWKYHFLHNLSNAKLLTVFNKMLSLN